MNSKTVRGKAWHYTLILALVALIAAFANNLMPRNATESKLVLDERAEGVLRVHYIDVGQGDSELIELPNDEVMLIDAGENDKGELVAEYIKSQGIEKIDYLVGTHPHSDHIGGLDIVINEFDIGKIYMPKAEATTATFNDVLDAVENKGLRINTAKAGVSLVSGDDLTVEMLAPVKTNYASSNNYSAVIKIVYKNSSFLFTGDAERVSENDIKSDVSADVLKVGHHGSDTSSSDAFLERVRPNIAVISCGVDNKYGHPHAETLQKLADVNAEVHRTDTDGTVVIDTDGEQYEIYTENSEKDEE